MRGNRCGTCARFPRCLPERIANARARGWTQTDAELQQIIADSYACGLWEEAKK